MVVPRPPASGPIQTKRQGADRHTWHGVAAHGHDKTLPQAGGGRGAHRLVAQGARLGHDAHAAPGVLPEGHDADAALARGDDAGAVGPHEARPALRAKHLLHAEEVVDGDVLGDGHDDGHLGLDGLDDGPGRKGGGHKDGADVRVDLLHGLWLVNECPCLIASELVSWELRTSLTVPKTGRSRCVRPPLPGETPPTTFVP